MPDKYTHFGFELRDHAAMKSKSGESLDCKIVFGAAQAPDDEIESQRDLESLILSGKIKTFGIIYEVTSWNFNFPKVKEGEGDVCLITFNYVSYPIKLYPPEQEERVKRILESNLLPSNI